MGDFDVAAVARLLEQVRGERRRQHRNLGVQNHPDGTGYIGADAECAVARAKYDTAKASGGLTWVDILREEVAEAFEETDPARLKVELIQVAAVALAWAEALDRRLG